jgi:hypothetical protein
MVNGCVCIFLSYRSKPHPQQTQQNPPAQTPSHNNKTEPTPGQKPHLTVQCVQKLPPTVQQPVQQKAAHY